MSLRAVTFVREWANRNIDLTLNYSYPQSRAHVLAAACRHDANAVHIGLQEIEDEFGDLEEAVALMLQAKGSMVLTGRTDLSVDRE